MFSCFSKKKNDNATDVMEALRKVDNLGLKMSLNDFGLNFNPMNGDWTVYDENLEKRKQEVSKMHEDSKNLDSELQMLEKDYLAKITQLLLMAEVHCEIKQEINEFFVEMDLQSRDPTIQSEYKTVE